MISFEDYHYSVLNLLNIDGFVLHAMIRLIG